MDGACCAAGRSDKNSSASNSKPLSSDVTDGERFSAPVEPPVLIPGGMGLLMSPPKVQLLRKRKAVRALRLSSGSEDAASACTDETRLLVLTQRADMSSTADLLMLGFGDVARVRRTSSGMAGRVSVSIHDHILYQRTVLRLPLQFFIFIFASWFDLGQADGIVDGVADAFDCDDESKAGTQP